MTAATLQDLSARERDAYRELVVAYRALAAALTGDMALEPARLAADQARADAAAERLRTTAAALAPHRLGGEPAPAAVHALWCESATLAAEASQLNATLLGHARGRQARISAQLTALAQGRRALAGYRPAIDRRDGVSSVA